MLKMLPFSRLCLLFIFLMLPAQFASARETEITIDDTAALKIIDTQIGTGDEIAIGDGHVVEVKYTSWLYSETASDRKGRKVESSADSEKPYTFRMSQFYAGAIIGLSRGVDGMKVGGKRTLIIPSTLAYGSRGVRGKVPGNSALVYEIELVRDITNEQQNN
ncbi:MAG: FKBP-type peptidyl-prolyl cis-trans isomerase [Nitrosomonadales bacterium]|nr:FKBP-type peptidyl-prolyl cis-trans isomerase [Nitrosomonadales bacterium]